MLPSFFFVGFLRFDKISYKSLLENFVGNTVRHLLRCAPVFGQIRISYHRAVFFTVRVETGEKSFDFVHDEFMGLHHFSRLDHPCKLKNAGIIIIFQLLINSIRAENRSVNVLLNSAVGFQNHVPAKRIIHRRHLDTDIIIGMLILTALQVHESRLKSPPCVRHEVCGNNIRLKNRIQTVQGMNTRQYYSCGITGTPATGTRSV